MIASKVNMFQFIYCAVTGLTSESVVFAVIATSRAMSSEQGVIQNSKS